MPSILTDADKETVKRQVPKPANKILAVAVARLYVAYPDPQRWTYTGVQGAVVLCNDLVGRTFWLKIVDVSPAGKGVIWDQEIYHNFSYNQDRTFFHTFELENCPAGLSFADEKEAKTFIKKVHEREKHASKETSKTPFASSRGQGPAPVTNGKAPGRSLFGSLLHRSTHAPSANPPPAPVPSIPVGPPPTLAPSAPPAKGDLPFDINDPTQKGLLDELLQMGITEDQIADNSDFIKSWIAQKQTTAGESPAAGDQNKPRAPPPPPPGAPAPKVTTISPQGTGTSSASRRGPPPPPPTRKGRAETADESVPSPPREPSPPPAPTRMFRAPLQSQMLASLLSLLDLYHRGGHGRHQTLPRARHRPHDLRRPQWKMVQVSLKVDLECLLRLWANAKSPLRPHLQVAARPAPASPKVPTTGAPSGLPPPPPARAPISPPPPPAPRPVPFTPAAAPPAPPPPPPRGPAPPATTSAIPPGPPPPPPGRSGPPVPPPPPPVGGSGAPGVPPPPPPPAPGAGAFGGPPPPPPPGRSGPAVPPPPPPPGGSGGPPPPPAPGGAAPPLPKSPGGRDDLLAAIRGSGGAGGGGLRKVKDSDKKDRSSAMVPGSAAESSAAATSSGGGPQGGLAGALQDALNKRKQRVSGSDDEKDDNDDW
ncbi:uncharacterized protein N7458_008834 [Penicillium daleae]|uniref:WH1 domain-containing protein n=1 Tax=Penicillium daleae TaxID=63821 RepID=A0AAD6BVU3_9EURO|nr:uncharacterized protein N7458_008834 [Penicillium daleae]KAJ5437836.1 hypothetical protein N7458_008834 [Penicillium daleae]